MIQFYLKISGLHLKKHLTRISNLFLNATLLILLTISLFCSNSVFAQTTTETITATGTWTCPPGVTSVTVECIGGGGAGGGATGNPAGGGGGSAGGYASSVLAVTPGNVYNVTVGTGGAGGTGAGGNGSFTWFGTAGTVYAVGGLGGAAATVNGASATGAAAVLVGNIGTNVFYGGAGGTGAAGLTAGGGGGGAGTTGNGGNGSVTTGGTGGTGGGADGGNGGLTTGTGSNGYTGIVARGGEGGGGGRAGNNTDRNGGAGRPGVILISYNTPPNITPFTDLSFCGSSYPTTYQTVSFSLKERLANDFGASQTNGTIILTLPTGFEFNTAAGPTVTRNAGDITAISFVVATSTITVTLTTDATPTTFDSISFNNFQIRAIAAGSGNLIRTNATPGTFLIALSTHNPLSSESFGFMYSNTNTIYDKSTVTQYTIDDINKNCSSSRNAVILSVKISFYGGCPPPEITQFDFSTLGDPGYSQNPATNISTAKIYFNHQLAGAPLITNQTEVFGSVNNPNGPFTITGSQFLDEGPGDYYFFLVYDIPVTATATEKVDASMTSFVMDGTTISDMTTPNPSGTRTIIDVPCYTPDIVNPSSNIQTIPRNSYVIPMDNTYQALVAPFNLKAYGLVHSLLMNDIPVKWVIRSGKAKDDIDFTANASRVYPSVVAAADMNFIASAFIIDSTWINKPFYGTGKSATQVITDYYAQGAGYNQVTVYKLTNDENLDVRYTLTQRPKLAIFSNGGFQTVQINNYLIPAGITNYFVQNAGNFTGLAECYTFCSEAHWDFTTNSDINPVDNVLSFVNEGGNFLAQCAGIDLYEDHQPDGGHFVTTKGINFANATVTNTYSNPDMAYSQFQGTIFQETGTIETYWPGPTSSYLPDMYYVISAPLPSNVVVASAIHLSPNDSIGGNVYYLGGHDYLGTTIDLINGAKMYLNTTLVPAARPTAFTLDAGTNRTICEGQSTILGGSPTGGSGSCNYIWSPITGLDNPNSANPVCTATTTTTYTVIANDNGCPGGPATVTITVNPLPAAPTAGNNGPLCVGNTLNLTASTITGATYTWAGPNGFTSNLQNPSITNITASNAGSYSVIATVDGCDGPSGSTTITINPLPAAPTASSNSPICEGQTLNLTASNISGASYSWTGPNSFTSAVQNPSITSTTLAAAGLYSVTASVLGCEGPAGTTTAVINATPTISNAGPDQTLCNVTTATLAGNTPVTGTGTWTVVSGTATITSPTSPTSGVTGLTIGSTVTLRWTISNGVCTSSTDDIVIQVDAPPTTANAGPDQNLCNATTTSLAGNTPVTGAGSWSVVSGTATITSPTSPSSGVTGLTIGASATLRWTISNGTCISSTDDIIITVSTPPTTANAGPDQILCNITTATLAGNTPASGTGTWSIVSGTATITAPTSPTSGVTGLVVGASATLQWTISNGGCTSSSDNVIININALPTTANAGPDQTLCNITTATLAGNTPGIGTGAWTVIAGTATVTTPSSPTSGVTGLIVGTSATLRWTISNGVCTSSTDDVIITVNTLPTTANAGPDQNICNVTTSTLAGNTPTDGTGTWTVISGTATITTPSSPTSGITGLVVGASATLRWTITNGVCTSSTDDVIITVSSAPTTANAGPDQNLCNVTTTTLAGNTPAIGTGTWTVISGTATITTPSSPTSGITGLVIGSSVTLQWTISNGGCTSSSDDVIITVDNPSLSTSANAGPDQSICNITTATLAGNTPTIGIGTWSVVSGTATITTPSSPTSGVTGLVVGASVTLRWTITDGCATSTDDVIITVYSTPTTANAGPDQTLCNVTTSTLAGNTPAIGTGTWTVVSGTATITTPSSPTSGVTGLTVGASVTLKWTISNGACTFSSDNVIITINANPTTANAGPDQNICNITTATLAGNTPTDGTGTWTVVSGTATITTPSSPTSGVTGLTIGASVTLRWTISNGVCTSSTDDIVITVNAPPTTANAGPDQSLCNVTITTLAGNTPAIGTGTWTVVSGTATITTPSSPTSGVTGLTIGVSVTLQWTISNGSCTSSSDNVVIIDGTAPTTANAGPDQSFCNLTTATLAGNTPTSGTGLWTVVSGTATITTPTSPTSGVTGLTVGTSATLQWTISNGSCTSSSDNVIISVNNPPTTANAGPDQALCNVTTATLTANTPTNGTGTWTVVSGTATITTPSSPTSGVTGLVIGASVTLQWSISNGVCPASTDNVIITVDNPTLSTTANAGPDQALCNTTTATLAGNTLTAGSGTWSVVSGTATITTPSSPTSGITGLTVGSSVTLKWTIVDGCTTSSDNVVITIYALPTTANAGPDQTFCNLTTATLAGNTPVTGTGAWSVVSGTATITTPSSPTSGVTGLTVGSSTTLQWTISNGACTTSTDNIVITVDAPATTSNAGPDQTLCNVTTTTLAANTPTSGTGTWTVVSGTATITTPSSPTSGVTGLVVGASATLRWTISNSSCSSSTDDIVITINALPTTANAGADQNLCNVTTTTLAGNTSATGTGTWSVISGTATITTPSSPTSGVTGLVIGASVTLRWTISNGSCTPSTDDLVITVYAPPTTANAGSDQTLCNTTTATLAGNTPVTGTGAWSVVTGTATITTPTSPTSGVTGLVVGSSVTLRWRTTNGSCTSFDNVIITVNATPTTASAGPDQTLCNVTTTTLAGNAPTTGTGTWTVVSGTATITTPSSPTSGITGLTIGSSVTLRWTISNGVCTPSTDDVIIQIDAPPTTAYAGPDQNLCNVTTTTLAGNTPVTGTGSWTVISGTATITTPSSPTSEITGLTIGSSVTLRWTISNGVCTASTDDVIINVFSITTTSNAGPDQTLCNVTTTTLAGNTPTSGTGAWTVISGTATVSTPSSPTSGVTGLVIGASATLQWTVTNGACASSSDNVVILIDAAPTTANAGTDQNLCNLTTATLAGNTPVIGTGLWTVVSGTATITNPSSPTSGITGLVIGASVTLQWSISNGVCTSSTDDIVITTYPIPTMTSTNIATICSGSTVNIPLTSDIASSYIWVAADNPNTSGESTTNQSTSTLNNTIINTSAAVQTVTYTVTPTSTAGTCVGTPQTITVTVIPNITMTSANSANICTGNTVNIPLTSNQPSTYTWVAANNPNTTGESTTIETTSTLTNTITNNSTSIQNIIYTVTPTSITGSCPGTPQTVTVRVIPNVTMTSSNSATLCSGSIVSIPLTSNVASSYIWVAADNSNTTGESTTNQTTSTLSNTIINTSGSIQTVIYTVTPTSTLGGCPGVPQTVTVTVNPIPDAPTASGETICQGTSATLTATAPGGTYEWFDAAIGGNLLTSNAGYITPDLNSTTTYYVQTTVNGCTSSRTPVVVTVNPIPAAPTASGTTICNGFNATLNTTAPGGTYEWYDAAIGGSLLNTGASYTTPVLTATTTYYVQTTINGCTGSRTSVVVTVTPTDNPSFTYPSGTYCITGSNPIPTITGGFPGAFTSSPAGLVFVSTTTGEVNLGASALNTYSITYTTTGPCPDNYSVNLTITIAPDATFSYNDPYCQTETNPLPSFIPGASAGVFSTTPAGLNFINTSTGEIDLTTTTPGVYTVTNTIPAGFGCALTSANDIVTINTAPTVDAGAPITICDGESASVSGSVGGSATSATWSAASGTFANPNILSTSYTPLSGSSAIWLYLTTNDPAGPCSTTTDSLFLTITPIPDAPTAFGTIICAGTTASLMATASGGGTYQWYDAATGGNLLASTANFTTPVLNATTTYYVQTTVSNCASPRTPVIIDVTPLPAAPTAADASICNGESASLSATAPGGDYEWYSAATGGTLLTSNSNYTTPALTSTTSYFVQTTVSSCTGPREEVIVTVNPIPAAPTSAEIAICYGNSGTITATAPGETYEWFDASTGGTLLYTGASYTTPLLYTDISYFVQSTILGCTGSRTEVHVTVNPLPAAPTASDVTICQNSTATLTATAPGGTYNWFNVATGGTSLLTGATYTTPPLSSNTTYYVQSTILGCPGPRTPVIVNVTPIPATPTAAGTTICNGETATLTATAPGGNYEWYSALTGGTLLASGSTFTTPVLTSTTSYFVQTTIDGCTSSRAEVIVTVNPIPAIPTVNNISICDGSSGTLTATAPGGTYQWYDALTGGTLLSTGASFTTPPLNSTTVYYVQTTVLGCTSIRKAVTVTVNPIPNSPTATDVTICQDQNAVLTATAPGGIYRWYTAAIGGTLLGTGATYTTPVLSTTTTYYVQTTVLGCTSSRTPVIVTVNPLPVAPTVAAVTICEGSTATLNATAPGGTYDWYDASTGGNLLGAGSTFTTPTLTATTSFFVQSTILSCAGPRTEAVVTVTPTDDPSFDYSSGTFCVSGTDPLPVISGGFPGTFSATPAGLTFINTSTGEIDLSASTLNTYTITYTTSGPCPTTRDVTLTVTDAPVAVFSYDSPLCQTDINPLPIFPVGSSAGVFSASPSGLTFVDNISGEIDLSATTPGTYSITNFITASGGCAEANAVFDITINQPAIVNAGINQTVCEGFPVNLNGTIGGSVTSAIWSGGSGTFSDNTALNAIYTPAAGETSVILTLTTEDPAGPCPSVDSSMTITINPTPNAPTASGLTVCENNTAELTATAPGGNYEWFDAATGGTLIITNDTLLTSPLSSTTSFFVQTTINGCTSPRTEVIVNVSPAPVVEAGINDTACANNPNITLAGTITGSASLGTWTTNGSGTFIPNANTLNAVYIPSAADTTLGIVSLTLTTTDQPSECIVAFDTMKITYTKSPWVFAGNDKFVCIGNNANLHGEVTSTSGTGTWTTLGDGSFTNANNLITTYIPGASDISSGNAYLVLTSTTNGTCNPVTDTIRIHLVVPPLVEAGLDQTACTNTQAILNGSVSGTSTIGVWTTTGTGTFTPDSTSLNATYNPSADDAIAGTITLTLSSASSCLVQDNLTLTVIAAPTVNAGSNIVVCADATQITLDGSVTGITTTGDWSTTNGTGLFNPDISTLDAIYSITQADSLAGSVQFILTSTNNNECNAVTDTMLLSITTIPDVDAGSDTTICANNTLQLNGLITGGVGSAYWSGGSGTFISDSTQLDATYVFSNADTTAHSVVLTLTSTGACVDVSDNMTITISPAPKVDAGSDIAVCANNPNVTLNGNVWGAGNTGSWTTNGDGVFNPSVTDLNATYIPGTQDIIDGLITIVLTSDTVSTCYPAFDTLIITINPPPDVSAGNTLYICNDENAHLHGTITGGNGTGQWTTDGDGTFSPNDSTLNATYIPGINDIASGLVNLTLTSTHNGGCIAVTDNVVLDITTHPTVLAGSDITICSNETVLLNGSVSGSTTTGFWTSIGGGTFSPDSSTLNATYTPDSTEIANGTFNLYLTSSFACVVSDTLTVTVIAAPIANAGSNQVICQGVMDVNLNGSVTNASGGYYWQTDGTGTFVPDSTSLITTYQLSSQDSLNGSIILTLVAVGNGQCSNNIDSLTVTTAGNIQVHAGADITICASGEVFLNGIANAGNIYWSTLGTGTFAPDSSDMLAQYLFSEEDTTAGDVHIVLNSQTACGLYTDTLQITFTPIPYVNAGQDIFVCSSAQEVQLNGIVSAGSNTGIWTTTGNGSFTPSDTSFNALYIPTPNDTLIGSIIMYLTSTYNGSCIQVVDSSLITFIPTPIVNAGETITVCNGNTADLNGIIISSTGTGIWSTTGTGTFSPNDSTLTATYIASTADVDIGEVNLILSSTNLGSCYVVDTLKVLFLSGSASLEIGPDQSICWGDSIYVSPTIIGDTGTFHWTSEGIGTFSPNDTAWNVVYVPDSSDLDSGSIYIYVNYHFTCGTRNDSLLLTINPLPNAGFTSSANCANTDFSFNDTSLVVSDTISQWLWDFGDGLTGNTPSLVHPYTSTGDYMVSLIVSTNNGCTDTAKSTITVHPVVDASFSVSDSTISPTNSIQFTDLSLNPNSWHWTFGDGSGSSDIQNPQYQYNKSGSYVVWLYVNGINNCVDSASQSINVQTNGYAIPSAFSPNNDGLNDFFFVRGGPFSQYELRIFNDWGQQIFISNNQSDRWDGTFKGKDQPEGTYVYIFNGKLTDGTEVKISSDISLIR